MALIDWATTSARWLRYILALGFGAPCIRDFMVSRTPTGSLPSNANEGTEGLSISQPHMPRLMTSSPGTHTENKSFYESFNCKLMAVNDTVLLVSSSSVINTLRPTQKGCHFTDDTFKCIFLNQNVTIFIKISLKCVPIHPTNNIPALVEIMAWRRPGDKPLSEPIVVRLLTHICVAQPQWVKGIPGWQRRQWLLWMGKNSYSMEVHIWKDQNTPLTNKQNHPNKTLYGFVILKLINHKNYKIFQNNNLSNKVLSATPPHLYSGHILENRGLDQHPINHQPASIEIMIDTFNDMIN